MKLALCVAWLLLWALPVNAQAPTPPPEAAVRPVADVMDSKAEYIAYATEKATAAGLNVSHVLGTIECESHWNPTAVGDKGKSYGLVQVFMPVWGNEISVQEAEDPKFAIDFLVSSFKKGNANAWTCYRNLKRAE